MNLREHIEAMRASRRRMQHAACFRKSRPWAMVCVLLISSAWGCGQASVPPTARDGVLDLSNWDFNRDGPIELNGEWRFYWEQFLKSRPANAGDAPPELTGYLKVPRTWNGISVDNRNLTGNGFATLQLKLRFRQAPGALALKLPAMSTAYELDADEITISRNGKTGTTRESMTPRYRPGTALFHAREKTAVLNLRISNFHHRLGGIRSSIRLGTPEQIRDMRERSLGLELFLFGALAIMGLYHLGLYSIRRENRAPLFFALYCLDIALLTLIWGENFLYALFPSLPWEIFTKLNFLAVYLTLPFFALYLKAVFPEDFSHLVVKASGAAAAIFCVPVIFTRGWFYTHWIPYFEFLLLAFALYCLFVLVLAIYRKRDAAPAFGIGAIALFSATVNDILNDLGIIDSPAMIPLGVFIFVFAQAFFLSLRFSRAFQSVEVLSRRLMSLDRLKDEFLANTSHELRTPLNGIIGISESLLDGAEGELQSPLKSNMEIIASSGRRLLSHVNDILDFSRLKHRDLKLRLKAVDVHGMTQIVMALSLMSARAKSLELINRVPRNLPAVLADEDRIQQILHNLISNAVKFTDQGKIIITAEGDASRWTGRGAEPSPDRRAQHGAAAEHGWIRVSITDTGIGIPAEKLDRIFESFEQVDGSAARAAGGTGLGLTITKKLIELHGGLIEVQSSPNTGSTFTFSLPRANPDELPAGELDGEAIAAPAEYIASEHETHVDDQKTAITVAQTAVRAGDGEKSLKRILAVDDEPANLRVIRNQMKSGPYEVRFASSGAEALELMGREQFDLILLDVMMPRMTGYEVSRTIRERHPPGVLPIILLTARNQVRDLAEGFQKGANDYIVKPFTRDELLSRVNFHLELATSTRELRELKESLEVLVSMRTAELNRTLEELRLRDKSMQYELTMASDIQQGILPPTPIRVGSVHADSYYRAMTSVGGDFFDIFPMPEGRLGIVIGDASGHGIPAALLTAMAKIAFNDATRTHVSPRRIFAQVNDIMVESVKTHDYLTAFLLIIDEKNRVLYGTAGHPSALVLRRESGELETWGAAGIFLGALPEANDMYREYSSRLAPGDRVLLYTDGLTEAVDAREEEFGRGRLEKIFADSRALDLAGTRAAILAAFEEYTADTAISDDVSFLLIEME